MNKIVKYTGILLTAYLVVLLVNLTANSEYYRNGGDWKGSVFFSLAVTTVICVGFVGLYELVLTRLFNRAKQPFFFLFISILVAAVYSCLCMVAMMQVMVHFFGWGNLSTYDYINNSLWAALITVFLVALVTGIEVLRRLIKSEWDNKSIRDKMEQTRFEVLKNQVNPHFLFNSLNTLSLLIPEDADRAVDFVQKLSRVFRYSLQHSDEEAITIADEIKIVESFLFLNKQRFDDKLVVDIHIDNEMLQKKIITQSLLMVVENAIKHNEISTENPLHIAIRNEDGYLVVRNNYKPRRILEASTGIGQQNIINRYQLVTPKPVLIDTINNWYTVKLPVL